MPFETRCATKGFSSDWALAIFSLPTKSKHQERAADRVVGRVAALVGVVAMVGAGDAYKSGFSWRKPLEQEGERLFPSPSFFAAQCNRVSPSE
jgi:hypothetical protein